MAYKMETQTILAEFLRTEITYRGELKCTPMESAGMILYFLDVLECLCLDQRIKDNGQAGG